MATGLDLRVQRVRARVRQADVASAARCSRARIGQLEAAAVVPVGWEVRYLRAVADLTAGLERVHAAPAAFPSDADPPGTKEATGAVTPPVA
jgi:hypothetical protein